MRTAAVIALPLMAAPALADPTPGAGFDVTRYRLAVTPDMAHRR